MLFLAGNLGYDFGFLYRHNWRAVIILLAALAPLTRAWEVYRARARMDPEVAYYLLSVSAIALVACMFLLELDWSVWWPLFVILGGPYTLVPYRRRCRNRYGYGHDADEATIKR